MGTFNIEYSTALPTAMPGLAKANLDVDEGYGAIGRSITQLGSTLFDMGEEQKNAADSASLSELIRNDQMAWGQVGSVGGGESGAVTSGAVAGG